MKLQHARGAVCSAQYERAVNDEEDRAVLTDKQTEVESIFADALGGTKWRTRDEQELARVLAKVLWVPV